MAVLPVLVYPDERLKQLSIPVLDFDDGLRQFIVDLEETLRAARGCVGLAAPQINRFQRIAIVDVSSRPKTPNHGRLILINPQILRREGELIGREGCLSIPDYTGNVSRAERIHVRAQTLDGESRVYDCEGYEARAVQHEIDHLDGVVFLDKLISRRELFRRKNLVNEAH